MQGVLLSVPEAILDVPALKRLWIHEVLRVYHDRLIDDTDRHWLYEYLQEVTQYKLQEDFHELLSRLDVDGDKIVKALLKISVSKDGMAKGGKKFVGFRTRAQKFRVLRLC